MTCGSTCRHGHVHCMMAYAFDYVKWCNVCWAEFDAFLETHRPDETLEERRADFEQRIEARARILAREYSPSPN